MQTPRPHAWPLQATVPFVRRLAIGALFLAAVAQPIAAQSERTVISGTVTDEATKQPIRDVTVSVVGTPHAASTNSAGHYTIANVPTGNTIAIEVRRLGYGQTRKSNIQVTPGTMTIDFGMSSAPLTLEAITSSATVDPTSGIKAPFAIAKLTAEQMPVPAMGSASQMLAGKIAGVSVVRASGEPGDGSYVQLRTPSSPFHSNSPLYVIDGVALSDNSFNGTLTMDFESMDIESIEVIKGAAAAALYGSRGANGVISIKTNRGLNVPLGQSQFTIKSQYGFDQVSTTVPKLAHHRYLVNSNLQWIDDAGNVIPRDEREVDPDGMIDNDYAVRYDNVGQVFQPGHSLVTSIALAQSSAATNLNISYDRSEQSGLNVVAKPFVRNNFRATIDHSFQDNLTVAVTATHTRNTRNPNQLSYTQMFQVDPDVNLLVPNNDGSPYRVFADSASTVVNPLYRQFYEDNQQRRVRSLVNTNAIYRPLSFLSLTGDFSYDRNDRIRDEYTPPGLADDNEGGLTLGRLRYGEDEGDTYAASLGATLMKDFGGLTARLTTKGESQRERALTFTATGTDFAFVGLRDMAAAATQETSSSTREIRTQSVFTALGLNYKDKYIGDFLIRHEGSSLFGPAHRWNDFYRAAGAYLVSSEDWWMDLPAFLTDFSTVKFRYSVGTAGNRPDFADRYSVLATTTSGLVRSSLGSPFIAPEVRTEQEAGMDLIYKNRLSFILTWARSTANNTLVDVAVPSATGFNTAIQNVGKSRGETWEGTVEGAWVNNRTFRWSTNLVVDKNKEVQLAYDRPCYIDGVRWRCDGIPLSTMWGRRLATNVNELPGDAATQAAADQFQVNDEGYLVWVGAGNTWRDGVAKDLWNTRTTINNTTYRWGEPFRRAVPDASAEEELIGDGQPDFNFGIGNTFTYKGFRFYTLFRGQVGGEMYNNMKQNLMASSDWYGMDQTGRPEELKKPYYYYTRGIAQNNGDWMANFVEPASWMKFAEAQVAYSLNRDKFPIIGKFGAQRMTIELVGRDLFTWTKFTGMDPEAGSAGVSTRVSDPTYPLSRNFTTAITLVF